MSLDEFSIIEKFFKRNTYSENVLIGIGDDCALLRPPANQVLAVTTDTLVSGIHFFPDMDPKKLGHKCVAVNLSDLAAMGAEPAWMTVSLTLPKVDEVWLKDFCLGLFSIADRYKIQLVGGDLTHGPLSITVQAIGFVPEQEALRRNTAKAGDAIFVSGYLGEAGAALLLRQAGRSIPAELNARLELPEPRIELGMALRNIAHAAIDISDGLVADLQHILTASHLGATLYTHQIPLSEALLKAVSFDDALSLALSSGDNYELCFTLSKENQKQHVKLLEAYCCVCVGQIDESSRLKVVQPNGQEYSLSKEGYLHF